MAITHTFHLVPELPHGASVLVADTEGDIHTYLSLAAGPEAVVRDLSAAFTRLARCGEYKRVTSAGVAALAPLTALAGVVSHFHDTLGGMPGITA